MMTALLLFSISAAAAASFTDLSSDPEIIKADDFVRNNSCPDRPGWFGCPGSPGSPGTCVSPSQLCDGRADCGDGWDERKEICSRWKCDHGVRCRDEDTCIHVPHRHICNKHSAKCQDGSDQAFCMFKIYTGCFAWTPLGLVITSCDECICVLKSDRHSGAMLYKSKSPSHLGSHVAGKVCLTNRWKGRFCDGVPDCLHEEDEDPLRCNSRLEEGTERLIDKNVSASERPLIFRLFQEHFIPTFGAALTAVCLVVFFVSSFVIMMCSRSKKLPEVELKDIESPRLKPSARSNVYVSREQLSPINAHWSWNHATLIREIGHGFYGTVYLAEEYSGKLSAVKTIDGGSRLRTDAFKNEVRSLLAIGSHKHVVGLLGYNEVTELLVFEFCQNGSLLGYIQQNRDSFLDELDPRTEEVDKEMYRSISCGGDIPVSDYLTLVRTKLDQSPIRCSTLTTNRHLLNTRRLWSWSKQISKGMKHLAELKIIHGDLALRNILLTHADVVKISDFGLSHDATLDEEMIKSSLSDKLADSGNKKPVPLAWMAVECFQNDFAISFKTDVWAFGICLWEMFTLGEKPYSCISPEDLSGFLEMGKRLEEPLFAPKHIKRIMTSCWSHDPEMRPCFESILELFNMYANKRKSGVNTSQVIKIGSGSSSSEGYVPMESLKELNHNDVCYWNGYKIVKKI